MGRDPVEVTMSGAGMKPVTLLPYAGVTLVSGTPRPSQDGDNGTYLILPTGTFSIDVNEILVTSGASLRRSPDTVNVLHRRSGATWPTGCVPTRSPRFSLLREVPLTHTMDGIWKHLLPTPG